MAFALVVLSCSVEAATYEVRRVPANTLTVDGLIVETQWQEAAVAHPVFHWDEQQAPETEFRALWDDEFFFFAFRAADADMVVADSIDGEGDIGAEDRVELFLATGRIDSISGSARPACGPVYYGLEIDSRGRTMDFLGRYYRRLDLDWDFAELEVRASTSDDGYSVEGRIPMTELERLGVVNANGTMLAGVFRAEFRNSPPGTGALWLSWQDPQTAEPDFHVPSAFGMFVFAGAENGYPDAGTGLPDHASKAGPRRRSVAPRAGTGERGVEVGPCRPANHGMVRR